MSLEDWFEPADYGSNTVASEEGTVNVPSDPLFPRAAEWLSRGSEHPVALMLGIPFSGLSISRARCDLMPSELRRAMWSFSTYTPSLETDLIDLPVRDLGNVRFGSIDAEKALQITREAISQVARQWDVPVAILGGDNSITAPAMSALITDKAGLITLDAHHDVRDYRTQGLSNGSPVRVLIDEGLPGRRIWQLGIKDFSNSREYSNYAHDAGINVVRLPEVRESGIEPVLDKALSDLSEGSIYVDVDLDVVDRGLAPGAPAAQPGGLHPSQVAYAAFMCGKHPSVRALDVVEVDPTRDVSATTVRLACLVILSFFAGVARRGDSG